MSDRLFRPGPPGSRKGRHHRPPHSARVMDMHNVFEYHLMQQNMRALEKGTLVVS